MDYAEYVKTLESVGDSILEWADPSHTFRGHTEVRVVALSLRKVKWFELGVILQGLNGCYCRVRAVLSLLRGLLRRLSFASQLPTAHHCSLSLMHVSDTLKLVRCCLFLLCVLCMTGMALDGFSNGL
jgi:hypothetical protein